MDRLSTLEIITDFVGGLENLIYNSLLLCSKLIKSSWDKIVKIPFGIIENRTKDEKNPTQLK